MRGALSQGLKSRWARAALGVALAAGSPGSGQPDVISVRLGGDAASTRVVIDLREAATGALRDSQAAPGELALLLKGASTPSELHGEGRGVIRAWKIEDAPGGALLTLDLAGKAQISRRFLLPPAAGAADYRYVVDLAPVGAVDASEAVQTSPIVLPRADSGGDIIVAPAAAVRAFASKAIPPAALTPAVATEANLL